jgi:hypothetical protein
MQPENPLETNSLVVAEVISWLPTAQRPRVATVCHAWADALGRAEAWAGADAEEAYMSACYAGHIVRLAQLKHWLRFDAGHLKSYFIRTITARMCESGRLDVAAIVIKDAPKKAWTSLGTAEKCLLIAVEKNHQALIDAYMIEFPNSDSARDRSYLDKLTNAIGRYATLAVARTLIHHGIYLTTKDIFVKAVHHQNYQLAEFIIVRNSFSIDTARELLGQFRITGRLFERTFAPVQWMAERFALSAEDIIRNYPMVCESPVTLTWFLDKYGDGARPHLRCLLDQIDDNNVNCLELLATRLQLRQSDLQTRSYGSFPRCLGLHEHLVVLDWMAARYGLTYEDWKLLLGVSRVHRLPKLKAWVVARRADYGQ